MEPDRPLSSGSRPGSAPDLEGREPSGRRRLRLLLGGVAAAAVLGVGGGALGWAWLNDAVTRSAATRTDDPPMQIALFTPETPEIEAGGVLDVGELSDGYVHRERAPDPAPAYIDAWDDGDYAEPAPPRRPRWMGSSRDAEGRIDDGYDGPPADIRRLVEPRERPRFGFDEPGPDYAAERRIRREIEQRERIEAERARRMVQDSREPRWRAVPDADRAREMWRPVPDRRDTRPVSPSDYDSDGYAG